MVNNPYHAFDDIVDIGKIAHHPAVVEHRDRRALHDAIGKLEQRHVRPSPRPVDGEEPEPGARNAEQMRIAVRHQFVGLLGRRVKRDRMIHVVVLRKWQPRVGAIHGTRRCIYEVPDARLARPLEHIAEARQIGVDVRGRIDQRVTHPRLRGKMHHRVEAVAGKQLRHGRAIGDIDFQERKIRAGAQACEAGLLEAHVVIVVQVVDTAHHVAARDEAHAKRVADKAGSTRNQYVHHAILLTCRCSSMRSYTAR